MSALMTLFKLSHYSGAEDSSKLIAQRILLNLRGLETATIQDMADFCYVSVATVSRFIRSAGYNSFAQFKQAVEYERDAYNYITLADIAPAASLDATMESYIEQAVVLAHKLRNGLDREAVVDMADAMYASREVYVYSFFLQSSLPYLQVDLNLTGKKCEICEVEVDQYRTVGDVGPGCFLLALKDQSADTHYMDALIRQVKRQGAKVGVILNAKNAAILDSADYILTFEGTNTPVDSAAMNHCISLLSIAYRKRYLSV